MAARAGVEPMTLRTKGVDSTKAPPRPTAKIYEGGRGGWKRGGRDKKAGMEI